MRVRNVAYFRIHPVFESVQILILVLYLVISEHAPCYLLNTDFFLLPEICLKGIRYILVVLEISFDVQYVTRKHIVFFFFFCYLIKPGLDIGIIKWF
jgi:hypothetical protein